MTRRRPPERRVRPPSRRRARRWGRSCTAWSGHRAGCRPDHLSRTIRTGPHEGAPPVLGASRRQPEANKCWARVTSSGRDSDSPILPGESPRVPEKRRWRPRCGRSSLRRGTPSRAVSRQVLRNREELLDAFKCGYEFLFVVSRQVLRNPWSCCLSFRRLSFLFAVSRQVLRNPTPQKGALTSTNGTSLHTTSSAGCGVDAAGGFGVYHP